MCGVYKSTLSSQQIAEEFEVRQIVNEPSGETYYPASSVPGIALNDQGERALRNYHWGYEWFNGTKFINTFNSRVETVTKLKTFKSSFETQRCLLPADGFYEWKTIEGQKKKQKIWFTLSDEKPFCFPGIWRMQKIQKFEGLAFCTSMLTGPPTEIMEGIHDRQPLILDPADYGHWLDPTANPNDLLSLLIPYPAYLMKKEEVHQ